MSEVICICECGHSADVHDWADNEDGLGCLESISLRRACPCTADRESVYESALAAKDEEIKRLNSELLTRDAVWLPERDAQISALTARNAELVAALEIYSRKDNWLSRDRKQRDWEWDYDDGHHKPWEWALDALEAKP